MAGYMSSKNTWWQRISELNMGQTGKNGHTGSPATVQKKRGTLWEKWPQRRYMVERNLKISGRICPAPCVLCQCTVVFTWKCCLFYLCAHGKCHVHHVEFHFRFKWLVSFPFKISWGVAVMVRGHKKKSGNFLGGPFFCWRGGTIFEVVCIS